MEVSMSKGWNIVRGILAVALLTAWPAIGYAQQAIVSGTVTDATGKKVAGVQIAATHVESGQTVNTVSDANGGYRIPILTGGYAIKFSAPGFATVNRTGIDLLLNQQGIVNIQLTASTAARTITVTGEAEIENRGRSTNFDAR